MKPHGKGPLTNRIHVSMSPDMFYALHNYAIENDQTTGEIIRHLLSKLLVDKLTFPPRVHHD